MPVFRCPTCEERFSCEFDKNTFPKAVTCPGCKTVFSLKRKEKPSFAAAPKSVLALDRPPESSLSSLPDRDISLPLDKIRFREKVSIAVVLFCLATPILAGLALWMALRETHPTTVSPLVAQQRQTEETYRREKEETERKERESQVRERINRMEDELKEQQRQQKENERVKRKAEEQAKLKEEAEEKSKEETLAREKREKEEREIEKDREAIRVKKEKSDQASKNLKQFRENSMIESHLKTNALMLMTNIYFAHTHKDEVMWLFVLRQYDKTKRFQEEARSISRGPRGSMADRIRGLNRDISFHKETIKLLNDVLELGGDYMPNGEVSYNDAMNELYRIQRKIEKARLGLTDNK